MKNIKDKSTKNPSAYLKIFQAKAFCDEALKDVSDVKVKLNDFKGIKIGGTYVHYNKVLSLARIIIGNNSITNRKESKVTYLTYPYAINMQRLFECYCRTLIKNKLLYLLRTGEKTNKKYDVPEMLPFNAADKTLKDDLYIQGNLKPDIILKFSDDSYFVFDVKYKDYSDYNLGNRIDRLQILAYSYFYSCPQFGLIFPNLKKGQILAKRGLLQTLPEKYYYEISLPDLSPRKEDDEIWGVCFAREEKDKLKK